MRSTEDARRRWDRMARYYDSGDIRRAERLALGDSRAWICQQAQGRTLEVAVGTGRNLAWYPSNVSLVGGDLSPAMLALARSRATELGRTVDLQEFDAQQMPFADASFDTVVCTLAVCEIPDRDRALAQMHRVLRPGGRLLLLDHVEPRWLRGRPVTLAVRHGFRIERHQRLRLGFIERLVAQRPMA